MLTPYREFIHVSRYARFRDDLGRRETWDETVDRVHEFFRDKVLADNKILWPALEDCMGAVRRQEIMPSMRIMMTAGPALWDHQVAGYNCAYTPVDHPRKFSEILYILMCGTGVGFSVERANISQLPEVPEEFNESDSVIVVRDSKLGWATGYRELIQMLYGGRIPKWDLSKVRPAGARLKTFGGRASGPDPLDDLFRFTVEKFKEAAGRKLTSLECHDLVCKIADIVVVGGVRRSALLSLSNLQDDRLRHAKDGDWAKPEFEGGAPYRAVSNNSVAYTVKPDTQSFLREFDSLFASRSGERGFFSRYAATAKYSREESRRTPEFEWGCNPCSEILLRPDEFCNLTEVIVRPGDTTKQLVRKVRQAAFLGTLQATLTNFRFLSKKWKENCEEERLLGVSLTGVLDHELLGNAWDSKLPDTLEMLRDCAVDENKWLAEQIGINQSAAVTCVKPSGTVSQLCDTASGLHPRYAKHYIRRVRVDNKDPVCQMLIAQGFPHEVDHYNSEAVVFEFPMEAPTDSITQDDITALDHLGLWQIYNDHWCEHKPSVTISYTDDEFIGIMKYVWDNFDSISGVSFLPRVDSIYKQAPYEPIDEERYNEMVAGQPPIDFSQLEKFETGDNTTVQPELACHAGACEL